MSKFKKTKKSKDEKCVSQPLNFSHIGHLGPLDITAATACNVKEPPTPCQGQDSNLGDLEVKTLKKILLSCDLQETLRTIIRDEVNKALEAEREALIKEIQNLNHPPPPCQTVVPTVDETQVTDISDAQAGVVHNSTDELDEDLNVSFRFGNPLYDPQKKQKKLKPNPAPRFGRIKDVHDSTGGSQTEVKEVLRHKFGPRGALRLSRDDERECLSQALQANIVGLVDRLQINYSNLPDQLISAGHMTEDECRMLRSDITSRKDQVRYLVSRTKCRDLGDIQRFLELIEDEVPDVVSKIRHRFEENKKNNVKCTTCALCQCSNNVDIKDVVDILWSVRAVSDGFYNEVIACAKPRGSQEQLWKSLVDICNSKQNQEKRKVYDVLFNFMSKKGNFDFIVKPLKTMLEKDGRLECHCHSSLKASLSDRGSYGVLSSCSPRSSWSESRQSTFSGEFSQEAEQLEERLARVGALKTKKLERQFSIEEIKPEETIPKQGLSHAASLDMLETIQEESCKSNGQAYRKLVDYSQTVEFHGPIHDKVDIQQWYLGRDENENRTVWVDLKRQAMQIHGLNGFDQNRSSEA